MRRHEMSHLFDNLKVTLTGNEKKLIVFPESTDERVLTAVGRLAEEDLMTPVLIGKESDIKRKAEELSVDTSKCKIIDPVNYEKMRQMIAEFTEIRKGKATQEEAKEILKTENYFGTMLVQMGEADGLVSGAVNSTSDTVRPALQIIKTRPGIKGAFCSGLLVTTAVAHHQIKRVGLTFQKGFLIHHVGAPHHELVIVRGEAFENPKQFGVIFT